MKRLLWIAALAAALVAAAAALRRRPRETALSVVPVQRRDIVRTVKATGTIEPRNLVPVRAPVTGRVEKIEAEQGRRVRRGERLAQLSSSERAAVLDQALSEGATAFAKWSQFYRPTPVVAPVAGLVISRDAVPGQTVRVGEQLFTVADELVVRAEVDESDIAHVRAGQKAGIRTDAFPNEPFEAAVETVGLQAKQVDGVSSYTVELSPKAPPAGLKTGMTAEVAFVAEERRGVLALPSSAVQGREHAKVRLLVLQSPRSAPSLREVDLGLSDGRWVEVTAGVPEGGAVLAPPTDVRGP